jgi:D-cysteine desulfhydrase
MEEDEAATRLPIYDRFPKLRWRVARVALATLPTPVERLPVAAGAWVKRDGLTHASNGGSKLRALEFFLGEARAWRRPLVAYGPEGSGWLIGLARFGPGAGLRARIITFPQPRTRATDAKRELLRRIAGGSLRRGRDAMGFGLMALEALPRVVGGTWDAAPPGGSDAHSTLGYVNAALELAGQVEAGACPRPDAIFVPVGSGGLAAGLALGVGILGWPTEVVGVAIAPRMVANRRAVMRLAIQAGWLLDLNDIPLAPLRVVHRYAGVYAKPTREGARAAARFEGEAGLAMDPVYSAKLGAAFLEMAGAWKSPLFWHTYAELRET